MQIVVHRGTHQIGGCATEYRTKNTRIFIDFGAELETENAKPLDILGVTKGKTDCDGVFFTHYHGDHIGLMDAINPDIPLYMGKASKEILKILNERLNKSPNVTSYDAVRLDGINTFEVAKPVVIGDIKITPYMTDHSAYDASMFKIESEGKTILHTGDFRTHGFKGKGVIPVLKKYVGKVDTLVCEGTTLSRKAENFETENHLQNRIKPILENNKYIFVVCSSTNMDRLAGICSVVPKGKYLICDRYQLSHMEYLRKYAANRSSLYRFDKALYYGENLNDKMNDRGFCMFVRISNPIHRQIMNMYKEKNPLVIYSMWKGYLDNDETRDFLSDFRMVHMHTSGHADCDSIKRVIDTVNPDAVIPIHTEVPEKFKKLTANRKLIIAKDKEIINMEE